MAYFKNGLSLFKTHTVTASIQNETGSFWLAFDYAIVTWVAKSTIHLTGGTENII